MGINLKDSSMEDFIKLMDEAKSIDNKIKLLELESNRKWKIVIKLAVDIINDKKI